MADYTTATNMPKQAAGTRLVPRSGIIERMASNGAVRLRALQSATKYDPVIEYAAITQVQRDALLTFYTANRSLSFTFTAIEDGVTRTCVFAPTPFTITTLGASFYRATVYLREV